MFLVPEAGGHWAEWAIVLTDVAGVENRAETDVRIIIHSHRFIVPSCAPDKYHLFIYGYFFIPIS